MNSVSAASAHRPMVAAIDHDVPTDLAALAALRREQAEARIAAAQRAVDKITGAVKSAPTPAKKDRERAALAGAQDELRQARAALKGLD